MYLPYRAGVRAKALSSIHSKCFIVYYSRKQQQQQHRSNNLEKILLPAVCTFSLL